MVISDVLFSVLLLICDLEYICLINFVYTHLSSAVKIVMIGFQAMNEKDADALKDLKKRKLISPQ